jgi:hypothetical protein
MVAPGFGPVGFGIGALGAGIVVGSQGHVLGGLALDTIGALLIYAGFQTYKQ